ncbi:MAG: uroporphyrinogen-III C-methyltransferase [bacterium]
MSGKVYLVGAGPGDPDLITRKGFKLLCRAHVVLTDALSPEELVDQLPDEVEVIDCGKRADGKRRSQEEIHELMKEKAREGKTVVRLQGGDPMIFGRGGEEIRFLQKNEVDFEVVPGVTAASSVSSRLENALTDREIASEVTLMTGHEATGKGADSLDWHCMANCRKTLVIYMGLTNLEKIKQKLIEHGRAPTTPVAIISNAYGDEELIIRGRLNSIVSKVDQYSPDTPATIVIGEVVQTDGPEKVEHGSQEEECVCV